MTNVVRPSITSRSAPLIRLSVVASTLEVASSRTRIRGSVNRARAIATRCRWPPDRVRPRSPTSVSSPSGSESMSSPRPAREAAWSTSSPPASRRVCDVVAERRREQERVLGHHGHLAAQRGRVERTHVGAVHADAALGDVVEPRDQHHERALAGPGRAHEGDGPAGLNREVHVAEHRLAAVVGESHVAELHAPAALGQRRGIRRRDDPRLAVEHLEHPGPGCHRPLGHPQRDAEHAHRPGEQQHVAVEGHEVADADRPGDRLPSTHEQQTREPELGEEADQRAVERAQARGHHRLVEHPADRG